MRKPRITIKPAEQLTAGRQSQPYEAPDTGQSRQPKKGHSGNTSPTRNLGPYSRPGNRRKYSTQDDQRCKQGPDAFPHQDQSCSPGKLVQAVSRHLRLRKNTIGHPGISALYRPHLLPVGASANGKALSEAYHSPEKQQHSIKPARNPVESDQIFVTWSGPHNGPFGTMDQNFRHQKA